MANALTYSPARVMAFDNLPDRRERAEALGAEVFDPAVAPASAQVAELTSGRGADCVIEAVGQATTLVESMRSARIGGTVSVIGLITDAAPCRSARSSWASATSLFVSARRTFR